MFFIFCALGSPKLKGKFLQKLSEASATRSIYGHSMTYSPKMDALFVGAEYQNDTQPGQTNYTFRMGAVYAYKYDTGKGQYVLVQTITPPSDEKLQNDVTSQGKTYTDEHGWAEIRQMGSFLTVSEDGKRLIVGAPYANTYRLYETGDSADYLVKNVTWTDGTTSNYTQLIEVGAALVYEYDDNDQKWKYSSVFIPQPKDMMRSNGLGRVGGISPSGTTLCLTYFNKQLAKRNTQGEVFTTTYNPATKSWTPLLAAPLPTAMKEYFSAQLHEISYGSSVQFPSETVLMIGVKVYDSLTAVMGNHTYPGTQVFVYKDGAWTWDHEFLAIDAAHRNDWSNFGNTIKLAGTGNSQILAVDLELKNGDNQMVTLQNTNGEFSYQHSSTFTFENGFRDFDFYQASANLFIASETSYADTKAKQAKGNGAICAYELDNDKKYQDELDLLPPEADRDIVLLNFGCSTQWKDETHVFIGAHNKEPGMGLPLDDPAVYFIALEKDNSKRNGIIIGVVIAAVVVIVIIVVVIVVVRKKKANGMGGSSI